jgi:hypothetical protein
VKRFVIPLQIVSVLGEHFEEMEQVQCNMKSKHCRLFISTSNSAMLPLLLSTSLYARWLSTQTRMHYQAHQLKYGEKVPLRQDLFSKLNKVLAFISQYLKNPERDHFLIISEARQKNERKNLLDTPKTMFVNSFTWIACNSQVLSPPRPDGRYQEYRYEYDHLRRHGNWRTRSRNFCIKRLQRYSR